VEFSWSQVQNWSVRPTLLTVGVSFAVLAAILWPLEKLFPARRGQRLFRSGFAVDLMFWVFTPLVTKAITYAITMLTVAALLPITGRSADLSATEGWGLVGRHPFWLQCLEVIILGDFIFYWTHRLFHTTRLWPAHAVHHSIEDLDWLSSARFHPINDTLTRVCQVVPLTLLGFSPAAVIAMVPVAVLFIIVNHANVGWTWGPLRYVFVSPVYHQWHHTSEDEGLNKNFAGVLVAWDWLFGTMYMPRLRRTTRFGVKGGGVPRGFFGQLAHPFFAACGVALAGNMERSPILRERDAASGDSQTWTSPRRAAKPPA